jgi:NAD(P)-dependent dehydrogenase (short-subunit alcohol dehydrogenase family)
MSRPMRQRTALVTGAARGIGAAIAESLRQQDVRVLDAGRAEMDLSDPASITAWLGRHGGEVDILVNNAGINVLNDVEAITPEDWSAMVQVDLTAPLQLLQGVAPGMRVRGWGRIVNISSIFGVVTRERRGAYSAVKAGLNGLTRTAAVELAPYGILVNSVCPGYVATDLTRQNNSPADLEKIEATIPMGRLAEPEEIARFVGWLCSEANTYLTGQTILVDGGFTCR